MRIHLVVAWYDVWIGAYWDRTARRLYVMPVPMFGFYIDFERAPMRMSEYTRKAL